MALGDARLAAKRRKDAAAWLEAVLLALHA
jgi:hypothetical protein